MSTQPLLSGASAAGGPSAFAAPGQKKPVGVTTSEVTFEVRVPGVTKSLQMPKDEAELPRALEKQPGAEKTCDIGLSARVGVRGARANEVSDATTAMHFSFNQLMTEFEAMGEAMTQAEGDAAVKLALATQFHEHVKNALTKSTRGDFARRESMALITDFTSAERMLEQGVEGYVRAVQRALKTDLDSSVRISLKGLNYLSRSPVLGTSEANYPTIATVLFNAFLAPFIFTFRTVRNVLMGAPAIEYRERKILEDINGLLQPGRLTLVLGPPGCGKTTLLKAISGKLYQVGSGNAELKGSLRFNGNEVSTLKNLASWVSYVRQSDEHQALLTTRETLEFAFKCRKAARYEDDFLLERVRRAGGGEDAVARIKALKDIEVDIALAVLGLTNCSETIIGNDVLKGVSGGEKRRVTLGEMLVTGAQIMCADEISTGLDSAATYDITKFLRSAAHVLGNTIVVALLQPAPEVLNLFDDLIVMAEGRLIYHGPRDKVQEYFESLGFRVPPHKDLGDFIVELPTRNGIDFQLSAEELREQGMPKPPLTPAEFAQRWKQSEMHQKEMRDLEQAEAAGPARQALNHDEMPQNPFFRQLWYVLSWSMLLRLRAKEQVVARLVANAVVGGFFGTLFFNLQLDDWWLKAMLFAMALMFLISTAFPVVQVTSQQKPIFLKHIEAKFYSPLVFSLAQFLVSIPFVTFDVAFFATSLYWMCNLARHAENFAIFTGICILFGIFGATMMALFPFITPDQDTAIVIAALVLIVMIIASGAISTESMIPPAFRWMIWLNPFAYSYRALAINEYSLSGDYEIFPCRFEIIGHKLLVPDKCSSYFLSVREVRPEKYWVWVAAVVNVIATTFFLLTTIYAVAYLRFEPKRVGAVATVASASNKKGKHGRVAPSEDEIRNAEHERYLSAMSPRNQLMLSHTPVPSQVQHAPTPQRRDTMPFQRRRLIVRNLTYTIPINGEPVDFLQNVSFYALPGRMTALMGSSGAGKTTLMDVIAGRKTVGYAKGSIMVDDKPKIQSEFTKYTGYVEQFGVHAVAATVEESLDFSAKLRLPASVNSVQRAAIVKATLQTLELEDIKDALAGTLSMEQNKRLTLGVELVANPSIIFCDEPTSGLDARAAAIVMSVLLKVARQGRTVVCTIHQPSTAVFSFFDDLLLLKRGGQVVFFGELGDGSKNLIAHLEAIPGAKKFEAGSNPATYMLDCIGAGTGADAQAEARRVKIDYAHAYEVSPLKRRNDQMMQSEFPPVPTGYDEDPVKAAARKSDEPTFVRGFWTQLAALLHRNWLTYYRSPEFSLNRIAVVMMFTALFAGFFFHSKMETVGDVEGRIVLIFFFSSLSALYSLYTLVPFAMSRRALYYRERAAFTYSVATYNWAEGLVEIPYILIQILLTVPILYYITNMPYDDWERPIYFTIMILVLLLLMTSMAFFMASLFSDPLAAQLASIGALLTLMVFCGVMVPRQDLPEPYVPMYYISYFKYSSEGLLTTQFHNLDANICVPAGKAIESGIFHKLKLKLCTYDGSSDLAKISGFQIQAADFVLNDFAKDYKYAHRWLDIGVLGVWIVGLRLFTYIITLYVNHNRR